MKFQLFGRLRDDDDNGQTQGQERKATRQQENNISDLGSTGIQRTVENLFEQGYSEEEVRQELQGQYSRDEIQSAINQAVKTSATTQEEGPQPMTPYQGGNQEVSPMDEGFNNDDQTQPEQGIEEPGPPMDSGGQMNNPAPQAPPQQPAGSQQRNVGNVEEMIETIVAENFERVEQEFENAYTEIDQIKEQMEDLEDRVNELEIRDDEDDTQVIQKMDDLEQDINDYQSRIGGLEKAFQQILPSLVDNVRDLTALVQEIKQEKGIETTSNIDQEEIEDIDMEDW